ncbi:MAG: hypothetical protein ACTHJ2_09655 [Candidatus Nitrosocosmicus sp.]
MGFFKKWFAKDFATKENNYLTIKINKIKDDLKKDIGLLDVNLAGKIESLGDRLHYSTRLMSERLYKLESNRYNNNKDKKNKEGLSLEHIKKLRETAMSAGKDKPKVTSEGVRLLKERISEEKKLHQKVHNTIGLNAPTAELWKTTDAIIDILNNSKKDLHYRKIYTIIKNYNLIQTDLSLQSLKAAMYNLKMSRKIEYGKEAGTFRKKRSI